MIRYFEGEEYVQDLPNSIEDTEFEDCQFHRVDLCNESFRNSKLIECQFNNCNLSNVQVTNLILRDVKFKDCKMIGINWSSIKTFSDVVFEDCLLNLSVFQGLNLSGTVFKNCSITDVDFSSSKLMHSNFSNSKLSGSVFNESNLENADFRGAVDYFIDSRYSKIRKAKFSMPEALVLLKSLDIIID